MIHLRPYQQDCKDRILAAWQRGVQNVGLVLPTGLGKTAIFSNILSEHDGYSVAIAHRRELVGQMALALARWGVRHRVIGPPVLVKFVIQEQMRELGTSFFDPNARCAVASVDTLVSRAKELSHWTRMVSLWITDEMHHVIAKGDGNKWGKACALFSTARGLGVTATPQRADGRGLGRVGGDGLIDELVIGPSMRWGIDQGYLTDYRVFCPPSDIDLSQVPISDATGDYSPIKLSKAVHDSHIVGDMVQHYFKITPGKLGVVFNTDIETAAGMSSKFIDAQIRCEVVTGKTPDAIRSEIIRRFRKGDLRVLSSVDIFSEGFDLPAVNSVMLARPTQSFGLLIQQIGRGLRPVYAPGYPLDTREGRLAAIAASDKPCAMIIDAVGNILRHGLPDAPRNWSLLSRDKKSRAKPDDEIPLRPCPQCTRPYERCLPQCPYCGWKPEPSGRGSIEMVDGDLFELDPTVMARMRSDVEHVDAPFDAVALAMQRAGAPEIAIHGARKQHRLRQEMQEALRASITWWAGHQRAMGRDDAESYRRFYFQFGCDILTAQSLGRPDALALADRINAHLGALTHA